MNNTVNKKNSISYFTAGLSILGFSFLPGVLCMPFLRIVGIIFLLIFFLRFISLKINSRWLATIIDQLDIPLTHMAVFFGLYGFAQKLLNAHWINLGLLVVFVAYIYFGLTNGMLIGRSLRKIFDKLNIFNPPVKIPKEI